MLSSVSPGSGMDGTMVNKDRCLAWRIGGPQGSGVLRMAQIFARACARGGREIYSRREYHSNITGRHSYFDVCVGSRPLFSHRESPRLLVCLDAETLARHAESVEAPGAILYADSDGDVALDALRLLDTRLRDELNRRLDTDDLPRATSGLLERAARRGIRLHPLPLRAWRARLKSEAGNRKAAQRVLNTLAVAASGRLLGLPEADLQAAVAGAFAHKPDVIDLNRAAVGLAYREFAATASPVTLPPGCDRPERLLLGGHEAVALGKLAAGLGLQTYYPISPASDESAFLEAHASVPLADGNRGGPLVLQVEDELAAVNMAAGGALTGARCATATSGPGLSLMTEGLGWAGMNEVPLVITHYQRGGPSTGMPTRTDQGDLQFVIHGGHGEFPRMVIASGDVSDAFDDALRAFDYAERYQLPVIHLLDRALTGCLQTVPRFDPSRHTIRRSKPWPGTADAGSAERFRLTGDGISPRPLPGRPGQQFWTTGVEHGIEGRVSEDPVVREQMMEKRARKLETAAREIPEREKLAVFGDPDAPLTAVTWGSTTGALREVLHDFPALRVLQLRLLWPFPDAELIERLADTDTLVVVENNYSGQLADLIAAHTGHRADHRILKYSGRPISAEALLPALQAIANGKGEARMVLRNPFE